MATTGNVPPAGGPHVTNAPPKPQGKPKGPAASGFGPATTVHLSHHATEVLGGAAFVPHKPKS